MTRSSSQRPDVTTTVEAIAPGGDGVAHVTIDGIKYPVFLRATAPGDRVALHVMRRGKTIEAHRVRVLEPSPLRVRPPCPHAAKCGGCSWMHLADAARVQARKTLLDATVLRALLPLEVSSLVHHPSPIQDRYRTRARWQVQGAQRSVRIGYHAPQSHTIVEVPSCHVLDARLEQMLFVLRNIFVGAIGSGEAQVALGAEGRPVFSLVWRDMELPSSVFAAVERHIADHQLAGASILLKGLPQPLLFGDPRAQIHGIDGHPLWIPPGSFSQANPAVSDLLVTHVRDTLAPVAQSILELYAGAGTFTVALAALARNYLAVESDGSAVAAARENLALRALEKRVVFHKGDAREWRIERQWDTLVLDPPRQGAAEVMAQIIEAKPSSVMYVSCSPTTLARDVGRLIASGRFEPVSLHTFDMFPHTPHLELALFLRRI